eukprot:gene2265-5262_t
MDGVAVVCGRHVFALAGLSLSAMFSWALWIGYRKSCQTLSDLESISITTLSQILHRLKNGSDLIYAAVPGTLLADGTSLTVHDKQALVRIDNISEQAWKKTVYEHHTTRNSGIWTSKKTKISEQRSTCNIKFSDGIENATVKGEKWKLPFQTINDSFKQADVGVVAAVVSTLGGRIIVGYQEVDEIVPVGLQVLGIGEFYLTHQGLCLRSGSQNLCCFTRDSLDGLITQASTTKLWYRVGLVLSCFSALVCAIGIARSELQRYRRTRELQRRNDERNTSILQTRAQGQQQTVETRDSTLVIHIGSLETTTLIKKMSDMQSKCGERNTRLQMLING